MTKESLVALIAQKGKENLVRIHFNNNLVENVYGKFDPDTQIIDIGGTDYIVLEHTLPSRCDDVKKGPITAKEYKPMFTVEGVLFIDDAKRIKDIDTWMADRL